MGSVFIIAEAGVNHNGSVDAAEQMIEAAARAGADAVKFQTFRAEKLATAAAPKAGYQLQTSGAVQSQQEMLRDLELDEAAHRRLVKQARRLGIEFMSSPFDVESVTMLERLGVQRHKVPSGELTNGPLLLQMARSGKPMILSTGMATIEEIDHALRIVAFGVEIPEGAPSESGLAKMSVSLLKELLFDRAVLLHCTTEYPAPVEEINLRAMQGLTERFGLLTGYSDHSKGIEVAVAAAALGAVVIEKHFSLDKGLPGPDHTSSIEPPELERMVAAVRRVEKAMGEKIKQPTPSERANIVAARKSLVAACPIQRGERFTEKNLAVKRPGDGVSPMRYWEYLGKTAGRDYRRDELIEP